jgi:hypothetical protein
VGSVDFTTLVPKENRPVLEGTGELTAGEDGLYSRGAVTGKKHRSSPLEFASGQG